MGLGIPEVHEHPITHVLCYIAAEPLHGLRDTLLVRGNDIAQVLRVHARRQGSRTHEVRKHDRDLPALTAVCWGCARRTCFSLNRCRFSYPIGAQSGDSIEELEAMPNCRDAEFLESLVRQAWQNRLVYLVLSERGLVLFEAKTPQPTPDIHLLGALMAGWHHRPCATTCLGRPAIVLFWRVVKGQAMAETRKLAAILAADVAGYSKLAGADEERTLARLRALRSDLIDPTVALHHGRVVKRTGDGSIVEFRSVVDAVRCAIEVQNGMVERNAGLPPERRIEFRVGIHLGDVVEESDGDLMGDGVNIAAWRWP